MWLTIATLGIGGHSNKALALPPSSRTSDGTIEDVCTTCKAVTFKDSKTQKAYFLEVTPRTKIYSNGMVLPFSSLQPGTEARVTRKHPLFTPASAKRISIDGRPNVDARTNAIGSSSK
ncbi:hypothetical protein DES53_111113 [Roseimicrobium gellanilyticum]|uniref:Uncharacterized protein n=1 Tax=Roseimicrobium gellanilyticum TaxID=748857 RepID=A0A366H904_9BACT|nr:hypothetical protein DES53_111113 [Roseimicrobium gellanilyticum]